MNTLPFPLSLQRVTHGVPPVLDNTERLQFHRQFAPVTFANTDFPRNPARTSSPSALPSGGLGSTSLPRAARCLRGLSEA